MSKLSPLTLSKVEMFGPRAESLRTSRYVCLVVAAVAFIIGTIIGVLIPLYVLPPLYRAADTVYHGAPLPPQNMVLTFNHRARHNHITPKSLSTTTSTHATTDSTTASTRTSIDHLPEVPSVTSHSSHSNASRPRGDSSDRVKTMNLTNGIYWSEEVEAIVPSGFDDRDVEDWHKFCNRTAVLKIEEGCGRGPNRLMTFENGTKSCCRYRQNFDQIQGDIFSFFLSRILGIHNLPPLAMMLVQPDQWQWKSIRSQLSLAQWAEDRPVIVAKYLQQLDAAYIPVHLRPAERRLHPVDVRLSGLNLSQDRSKISELAQWSDLIVFDYLTANLDRIVNNLYNMQWNPTMMESPTHNLALDRATGRLIFLDNESGLLHGYRLLDKYESYHRAMLDSLCVFRRQTVDKIRQFRIRGNIGDVLRSMFRRAYPQMHNYLPTLPERSIVILNRRLRSVHEVIKRCERLYPSSREV